MIHRPDRLTEILTLLEGRAGSIRVLPLHAKAGGVARRLLIAATKDRRAPLQLLSGLILHEENGGFTAAAEAVLRKAKSLPLHADG